MNWQDLKPFLAKAAPLIAGAIGGPAAAIVGGLVAETLDVEASPQAITKALQNNPEALIKIKELQSREREQLVNINFEIAREEIADTKHAREQHKDHWMPATITLLLATMVCGMFAALYFGAVPKESRDLIININGQVLMAFLTSVGFWIGSSRSSQNKDKANSKLGA